MIVPNGPNTIVHAASIGSILSWFPARFLVLPIDPLLLPLPQPVADALAKNKLYKSHGAGAGAGAQPVAWVWHLLVEKADGALLDDGVLKANFSQVLQEADAEKIACPPEDFFLHPIRSIRCTATSKVMFSISCQTRDEGDCL